MTTWILWISKEHPEHWRRAVEHGYWDMLRNKDIVAGDDVYFWQGGRGSQLLGWTQATSDARDLVAGEIGPWSDAATAPYARRFDFRLVSDEPNRTPKWGEVASATGLTPAPQSGIVWTSDPANVAWMQRLFSAPTPRIDVRFDDTIQVKLEDLLEDTRERASRTIALRRGQQEFRSALLHAYGGRCAVTAYSATEVLEAAHISPHRGEQTNVVTNGLLLRADVHTLFDLHLITITSDMKVRVAPSLAGTPYMDYDRQPLASSPLLGEQRPSVQLLESHHRLCPWYATYQTVLF